MTYQHKLNHHYILWQGGPRVAPQTDFEIPEGVELPSFTKYLLHAGLVVPSTAGGEEKPRKAKARRGKKVKAADEATKAVMSTEEAAEKVFKDHAEALEMLAQEDNGS